MRRTASLAFLAFTLFLLNTGSFAASDVPIPLIDSPIEGLRAADIHDTFSEMHNGHIHEASDIMQPAGTPVRAVAPGLIRKLFLSKPGGITVYQFDESGLFCFYYAHLERYAPGLHENQRVKQGDVIGFVGSTGNARPDAPHLHFSIMRMGPERQYWKGTYLNPYSALVDAARRAR